MVERGIPLAAMDKVLKKAGAPRVGEDAKEALRAQVEELAKGYTRRATLFARHAGRKTVRRADIELAANEAQVL